jgi:hypothetical protein
MSKYSRFSRGDLVRFCCASEVGSESADWLYGLYLGPAIKYYDNRRYDPPPTIGDEVYFDGHIGFFDNYWHIERVSNE